MKAKILLLTFLLASAGSLFAIDLNSYQAELNKNIATFKAGLTSDDGFKQLIQSLDALQTKLNAEAEIPQEKASKQALLADIQAVYSFVGEISADPKSYLLTNEKKQRAIILLGLTEEAFAPTTFCMPITKFTLWENKYVCYLVENKTPNLVTYKFDYLIKGKFSSTNGSVEAGVSKESSRKIYQSFKTVPVEFTQVHCEGFVVKVEEPKDTLVTPAPVVEPQKPLTKEQKELLKKKQAAEREKEKAKKKREAEKLKAEKKREAEKAKREKEKEKAAAKREAEKAKREK